jgi:DnaJ-domain-containing protein 1
VSISKRLLDLARANLNALLEKASGDSALDELSDEELEAELARRRDRKRREDDERRAAERAASEARARARAAGTGAARSTKTPPRSEPRPPPPRGQRPRDRVPSSTAISDKRLRELYAQLEVPYGAGFDEVKKSFRRLMRKYHPDLHIGNPQKHHTATQLTMSLTQAYNELEQHLAGGPNRER